MIDPTVNIIVNIIFGFLIGFFNVIIMATMKKTMEEPRSPSYQSGIAIILWSIFIVIIVLVYIYSPLKFKWLYFFGSALIGGWTVLGFFVLAIRGIIRVKSEKFFDI